MKKFITKTAIKIIVFSIIFFAVSSLLQSIFPIVTNYVSLGQMQNSDEAFVLMDTYTKVRPIVKILLAGVWIWFASTIARDAYKFIKNIENAEKEKI